MRRLIRARSGRPPRPPRRPVHDARPRDRRPADLGQGGADDLGALRRGGAAPGDGAGLGARPARVSRMRRRSLRRCGLSERKADYLRDLARHFASGTLDPGRVARARRRGADRAAHRRQRHRPLDGRDVPHLPRAPRRRLPGRRHRAAEGDRASTTTTASGSTVEAMHAIARAVAAVAQRRDVVPVALARSGPGRVLTSRRCATHAAHPYAALTPDVVLDALDGVGFRGDGRLLPLGSYENRVYQIWRDDGAARRREVLSARTLDRRADPRGARVRRRARGTRDSRSSRRSRATARRSTRAAASASPCTRNAAAARPSSRTARRSNGWAASWAASTRSARAAPFAAPARARRRDLRRRAARLPARARLHPRRPRPRVASIAALALDGVRRAYDRAGDVRRLRLHGDCHAGNVLWTDDGPHFVDFDDARTGPAVQDLWMLLAGDRAAMTQAARGRARRLRGFRDVRSARAPPRRGAAHAAPPPLFGVARACAGTTRRFPRRSRGSERSATGRTGFSSCASRWR